MGQTRRKKKNCYFKENGIKYIDYKDTELLRKFITPYEKIMSARRTGTSRKYQRKLTKAIKRARFMGLMPFVHKPM